MTWSSTPLDDSGDVVAAHLVVAPSGASAPLPLFAERASLLDHGLAARGRRGAASRRLRSGGGAGHVARALARRPGRRPGPARRVRADRPAAGRGARDAARGSLRAGARSATRGARRGLRGGRSERRAGEAGRRAPTPCLPSPWRRRSLAPRAKASSANPSLTGTRSDCRSARRTATGSGRIRRSRSARCPRSRPRSAGAAARCRASTPRSAPGAAPAGASARTAPSAFA